MHVTSCMYTTEPTIISGDGISVRIGAFTVIEASAQSPIIFEGDADIGHQCYISSLQSTHEKISFGSNVYIDTKCHVYRGAVIGARTQVLYGAKIFELVRIGSDCIVGSDVANWVKMGNRVTYMGAIAHSNRRVESPTIWNSAPHPSPSIADDVFVGERAILIGGIEVGEFSYVAAGEVVRCNVPPRSLYMKSTITPLSRMRGFISTGG